ncbi:MAG: hypothetical protein ACRDY1_01855 [Acidimicrobiales bacterium]
MGFGQTVDPAGDAAYGLVGTGPLRSAPFVLIRTPLGGSAPDEGPALPTEADLVVADGSLWAGWSTVQSPSSPALVCQFDLGTMTLVRAVTLPAEASGGNGVALAPGPGGNLLVGDGTALLEVGASDGAPRTVTDTLAGAVDSVSAAPQGDVAYVATRAQEVGETQVVQEVDLNTGVVVASNGSQALVGVAPGTVTAVDTGVWLSWRTGMAGATVFLARAGLAVAPVPSDPHPADSGGGPGNLYFSIMGENTVYGDGVLWIGSGDGQIGCVDPSTGAVRAETTLPTPVPTVLATNDAGQLVVVDGAGSQSWLLAVQPPAACRSS